MNLNITYDANTLKNAPSGFFDAVNYVVNLYDTTFTSNATVNIEIGYGDLPYNGSTVYGLGESYENNLSPVSYSQVRQQLGNMGAPGAGTLPVSSPVGGTLLMGSAEQKALGLTGASGNLDGWVGIASNATVQQETRGSWSFNPTAVPGANQYYIVGVIEHEISEIMGRVSYLSNGGEYGLMDLYRYAGAGVRQTSTGGPAYFSTDGGRTNLDYWNNAQLASGDLGDWARSAGADAFLNASPPGQINELTAADLTLMRALGWGGTGSAQGAPVITSTGFDAPYYLAHNPDVAASGVDPYQHYLTYGWHEGRDPSAYFSTIGYLNGNLDVKAAGVDPLLHYDQYGWKEGRNPGPQFDTDYYLIHNPDVAAAGVDPLVHYLQNGIAEGRAILPAVGPAGQINGADFDPQYYLMANPDVAAAGVDPYQHFLQHGWKEWRDPDGLFDTSYYLAHNPDVAAAGADPLMHYDQYGWKEGRNPSPEFNTSAYLAANPDVKAAGVDPLQHFLTHGLYEGRVV